MGFFEACAITLCLGACFSIAVWRSPGLMGLPLFRATGYFLFVTGWGIATSGALHSSASMDFAGVIVALMIGGGCSLTWVVFMLHALRRGVGNAAAWAMSDDNLAPMPAYSMAEAAETRREFAAAEAAYRELAVEHPADPEPRRRLAEVAAKQENATLAVESMADALALARSVEDKCLLALRLSELQADMAHDPEAAVATLECVIKAHPTHRASEFARQRLDLLRQRLEDAEDPPAPSPELV